MSIDETFMQETCSKITAEYSGRAKSLGYNYFSVGYSKTALEKNQGIVHILAEFYRPLIETRTEKVKLRKLIPKSSEYDGNRIKIVLEYVQLPAKVRRQINDINEHRKKNH